MAWLRSDGRTIGCHAVLDKSLVDELDALGIIIRRSREIHAHGSIDLNVDKPGGNDLPAQIDDAIWRGQFIVETCLRIDDDAPRRIDPEILLNQVSIASKSAVGEFDQHSY